MNTSQEIRFYVVLDSKVSKEGLVKIYIRFFQGKKKTDFFTGIRWPNDRYDKVNELLLSRYVEDPDIHAHNLKIAQYKSLIHQIKMKSFVAGKELNIRQVIDSLNHLSPYTDFVSFALDECRRLNQNNIISYHTLRTHRTSIKRLCDFFGKEIIGIDEITTDRIAEMDGYYRKLGRLNNTIAGYHKNIKGYINKAIEKNLADKNPYDNFKFRYVDGNREALTQDELIKLMQLYESKFLMPPQQEILRRFLFSCLTGVRISDTHKLTSDHIIAGRLVFKPQKGMKTGKILKIPLPVSAARLIENRNGFLFNKLTDQHINRSLKVIGAYARIDKNLTYHCARDTFGTIFIELGGDIKSCCDLMGHSSTRTTQIYLKMSDERKNKLMSNFDTIFS